MRRLRLLATATAMVALAAGPAACGSSSRSTSTDRVVTVTRTVAKKPIPPATATKKRAAVASASASVSDMLGQMMVSGYAGSAPPSALLARIRNGEIGGVILFSENTAGGEAATRSAISAMQAAARSSGQPPLLVMTDQEGGEVKRLSWAPPALAPSEMRSADVARGEGLATGRALRAVGVNLDLAPVADVERVSGSFLGTRSFGSDPAAVAERACAFAEGLAAAGVGFTLKHFPGLGRALGNTDLEPVTINASATELREDYGAYERCSSSPDAVVMVNNASYPALTGTNTPAVMSPEIYNNELATTVGFWGVTISDALGAAALAHEPSPAEHAIDAGLDLALYAEGETESADSYITLRQEVESGAIPRTRVEAAYEAIMTLKASIAGASPQGAANPAQASSYPEYVGEPETLSPEKSK